MPHAIARSPLRRIPFWSAPALLIALTMASALPAFAGPSAPEPMPGASPAFRQPARSPETVLAYVDGVPVTQGRLTAADEDLGPLLTLRGPQREAYLLDFVIDTMLVARFAERGKVDQAANFDRRLEYEKTKLLENSVLSDVAARVTSEAAMRDAVEKAQRELILGLRKTATIERFSPAAKNRRLPSQMERSCGQIW